MSIRVMSLVWEHSQQTGNNLLLLLAIADFADDNGVAFPSVARLAKKSRMSVRNVGYVQNELVAAGELSIERGAGSRRGTNRYQILVAPSLPLFDESTTAKPAVALSRAAKRAGGANPAGVQPGAGEGLQKLLQGGAATAVAPEPSLPVNGTVKDAGGASPTPVALAFKAYAEGIKRKYNVDYPPSARANGMLAQVVARVGGDYAPAVVGFYLGSRNPWYEKVKHKLEFLVRDCEQLYMDLQRAAGGAAPQAPTSVQVRLVRADEEVCRVLGEFPLGEPIAVAKDAAAKYARMIAALQANKVDVKYIDVLIGAQRNRYSIAELAR